MTGHMDIPLDDFLLRPDTAGVRRKAREDRPWVRKKRWELGERINRFSYTCRGRSKKNTSGKRHDVLVWVDRDGQQFGRCSCPAGTPPVDPRTKVFKYQPRACYHLAAAYLHHVSLVRRLATREARQRAAEATAPRDVRAELFGAAPAA